MSTTPRKTQVVHGGNNTLHPTPNLQHPHTPLTGPDTLKDTVFVHMAATAAKDGGYKHYMGQKGFPMFSSLDNYCYEGMNIPDIMHNLSR